jgi:uncharacterized protein
MACPICNKPAEAKYRPFCSRRCADIDLGRWLNESYRIESTASDEMPIRCRRAKPERAATKLRSFPSGQPPVASVSPAHQKRAQIAQLVEQRIENPRVAGSIPALGTT